MFRTFYFLAVLLVGLSTCVFAVTLSRSYQSCITNEHKTNADNQQETFFGNVGSLLICEADTLNANTGMLTAIGTFAIAFFTLTLWVVTGSAVRLARDEFLSSHRPKIIVHSVEITTDNATEDQEGTVGASIIYFNIGDTPARVIEMNAQISVRQLPLRSGLGLGIGVRLTHLPVPKDLIESGPPNYLAVFSSHTLEAARFAEKSAAGRGQEAALVCIGQIVYEDGRHTRREIGFCRRLDAMGERWLPLKNSEYEYAY